MSQYHNENPSIITPSIALVDGDIQVRAGVSELPENAMYIGDTFPDAEVFNFIALRRDEYSSLLRQRCLLTRFDVSRITKEIESVLNSACDHHLYFSTLSNKLDFTSELFIRAGMIDLYNENNPVFWEPLIEFIKNGLSGQ